MRFATPLLLAALIWTTVARSQNPPPEKTQEPGEAASPALDWDRDFDLILESRQGTERENAKRNLKADAIRAELDKLMKEKAELEARREVFSGNVTGDEAMAEMVRLDAGTPDRARAILDAQLAEVRTRIADLEVDLKRAQKGKR